MNMRKQFYFYGLGALSLLAGGALATYAAIAVGPEVTLQAPRAYSLTPQKAEIEANFRVDAEAGKCFVEIKVTAPTEAFDESYNTVAISSVDSIELYRVDDDDNETLVKVWQDVAAGSIVNHTDEDELPFGQYTYRSRALIGTQAGSYAYAEISYGINPVDPPYPVLTSDDGNIPVTVKYSCPKAEYGNYWNSSPFPAGVRFTELRLFQRGTDGAEKILASQANPEPEQEFTYVDNDAVAGENYYYVRAYTNFGQSGASYAKIFLGPDYPGKVTDVSAVASDGTVIVTWTAPTEGLNGGSLKDTNMMFKVYRCDNDYFSNPTLLADAVTENRYVDKLEGLEGESMLYYRVYPYNDVEAPANVYNYGETPSAILAGPPAPLPFSENFNAGSKFNKKTQNNWEENFDSYAFSSYYLRDHATVENSGNEQEINCGVDGPGTSETGPDNFLLVASGYYTSSTNAGSLTTGNLSFGNTYNPIVSFWYVPVPGSTGRLRMEMSTGEYDDEGTPIYEEVCVQNYGELPNGEPADEEADMEWTKVSVAIPQLAGRHSSKLRFSFNYEDPAEGRFPMLFDQVEINDYPGAIDLNAEQNDDKILLSWVLPESAAGKKPLFKISLNGEEIAETEDTSYIYEGAEQGESYAFSVATVYDNGVEAPLAEAEPLLVPVTDFIADGMYYVVLSDSTLSLQDFDGIATDVVIPETVTFKDFTYPVTHVLPMLLQGQRNIRSLEIKARIDYVPQELCYGCVALETVKLPASVTEIEDLAFFGCASIETIELPETLTAVATGAFQNCLKLREISFGRNLASIGEKAFSRCQSLAKVTFSTTVPPAVEADAFSGIAEGCIGECPEGSEDAYRAVAELSPIQFPTSGLEMIETDDALSVEYFTPAGVRVLNPVRGETVIMRVMKADGSVKVGKRVIR